jgi:membrane fusion protein, multidrug efflux system
MDDLHSQRPDADAARALDRSSLSFENIPRSGTAHLFVFDDRLHLRDLDFVLPKLSMHQPATPLPEQDAVAAPAQRGEVRKFIRKITSLIIVAAAVFIILYVWRIVERHPRTDDASARANVVGIAPRVVGQIVKLNVQDNQAVKKGDVLFEIDPEDYKLVLEKAKADLAALDRQIEQAHSTLKRLEPLLPNGFTTADIVDKARTAETTLRAQRDGAIAAINLEQLHLSYCKVIAPFSGHVINLNISAGAHVTAGVPVFSLLDTSKWYVVANFREAEIRHITPGSEAIVYLSSAPNERFRGKVQGIGWAVKPEGEIDFPPAGVPYVKRELNWVRVAQRFPVRIEIENPNQDLFRMGASAVAIIKDPPSRK